MPEFSSWRSSCGMNFLVLGVISHGYIFLSYFYVKGKYQQSYHDYDDDVDDDDDDDFSYHYHYDCLKPQWTLFSSIKV
jgi:hypothetical protein